MAELKSNKKALDSQLKIYKSLRRILKIKKLEDITVADISTECGISRSSFYRNFNNIIEVLEVMFEWFYNDYLTKRKNKENQLEFFFEYWYYHRDLITIIAEHNEQIIKNCFKKYDKNEYPNSYELDIRISILVSILSNWSKNKKYTPAEMAKITKDILDKKCIDILLNYAL